MYLDLSSIQQLFPQSRMHLAEDIPQTCLTAWTALEHAPRPYSPHILYVCPDGAPGEGFSPIPGMQLLCVTDESHAPLPALPSPVSALFVPGTEICSVYARLQSCFESHYAASFFSADLLEILSSEGGVQRMVDRAYLALGNPMVVFDAGFSILAATWKQLEETDVSSQMLRNRGFSSREFEMANHNHIHRRMQRSETPLQVYNPVLGCQQLLCTLDTRKDMGHIVVNSVNRPFTPLDIQLLQILRSGIVQQLKKDEFVRNARGFPYESFLRDLLDGKVAGGGALQDRFTYICRDFHGHLHCLTVETARSPGVVDVGYVRQALEHTLPGVKTLIYNSQVIGIMSSGARQQLPSEALKAVREFCRKNHLYAGLSNSFQNVVSLPEYYRQALRAIELGVCRVNGPELFPYSAYYLDHVRNIFLQKESSSTFCHPKMKLLLDYDNAHGSQLAYTLYCYLKNERNIAQAAQEMHMHRNSVVYRIKKLQSLVGGEFGDYMERQYLILSYELFQPRPDNS